MASDLGHLMMKTKSKHDKTPRFNLLVTTVTWFISLDVQHNYNNCSKLNTIFNALSKDD